MKKILDLITAELQLAFTGSGYDAVYAKVTLSNRPDLCEYQCNGAMAAAKVYKKKPIDIAGEIAAKIADTQMFSEVTAVMPGFINLRVNPAWLADYLSRMLEDEYLGVTLPGHGETIIIDYGGANVAKPLHVGHLRSAVIGESIKRMGNFLGYRMIGDVHLGDWGLQMGLIIEELRDRKPELVYFDESYEGEYPREAPFTIGELEDIYPAASEKAKADEGFKERAQQATLRLQSGYLPFRAIWEHIMAVSLKDLKKNYDSLNVSFELWKGESDAQPFIPVLIQDLQDKGLAYESQGALVVDIAAAGDSKELPPCIVRKSDGAALYATSDLGTIIEREQEYAPVRYIYITDKRQELHFTQVFRVAKKAGYVKPETDMIHIGFGTMNGKDGKPFKTRDGGVMRLESLIADINEAAYQKLNENSTAQGLPEEEKRHTAFIVGLAALKYGDLSNQAAKDYVFDLERFVSFEGNTGPYLLYTIVRIKSIMNKYDTVENKYNGEAVIRPASDQNEKALMLELARFNEVMESCFAETAPHKLCQYVYETAGAFSGFYHDHNILAEPDKSRQASWIQLITLTGKVLNTCIDVLGFEAPERM